MIKLALLLAALSAGVPPQPENGRIRDDLGMMNQRDHDAAVFKILSLMLRRHIDVAILTTKKLDRDPKDFAVAVLNSWDLAPSSVLVMVSLQPRVVWIQPSDALADVFDKDTSERIAKDMAAYLRKGHSSDAILHGVEEVSRRIVDVGYTAKQRPNVPMPVSTPDEPTVPPPYEFSAWTVFTWPETYLCLFVLLSPIIIPPLLKKPKRDRRKERQKASRLFHEQRRQPPKEEKPEPEPEPKEQAARSNGFLTGFLVGNMLSRATRPSPSVGGFSSTSFGGSTGGISTGRGGGGAGW